MNILTRLLIHFDLMFSNLHRLYQLEPSEHRTSLLRLEYSRILDHLSLLSYNSLVPNSDLNEPVSFSRYTGYPAPDS